MTDKPKRISVKVRAAIDAMVDGTIKTVTAAADHAGLSREHLSRELSKPHVTEHLRQKIKRARWPSAPRAGVTKLALLDSPNEMVRDRASSYVLGLIGIVPDRRGLRSRETALLHAALADKPAGNALLPFCYPTAEYEGGEGGTSWLEVYPRTEQDQSFKDESSLYGTVSSELQNRVHQGQLRSGSWPSNWREGHTIRVCGVEAPNGSSKTRWGSLGGFCRKCPHL
jgi:hypothetical protein